MSVIKVKATDNVILFDWLSFTTKVDDVSSVLELLGLDCMIGKWDNTYGYYGYHDRMYFDGISIHFHPHSVDMGILVEMSGQGCRRFEESSKFGDTAFNRVFQHIVKKNAENPGSYNITRLDVAYDDFNQVLPMKKIVRDIHSMNFVSKFKTSSIRVEEHAGHVGQTCYFGSSKSDTMFRLYDKSYERGRTEEFENGWNRFEIQLRRDRAMNFVSKFVDAGCQNIGDLFMGVVNNYIRFVTVTGDDTNKRRWKLRRYWARFILKAGKISLYTAKNTEYNLFRTENYVHKQCSNSIEALINSKGILKFFYDMMTNKPDYSEKYRQISPGKNIIGSFLTGFTPMGINESACFI